MNIQLANIHIFTCVSTLLLCFSEVRGVSFTSDGCVSKFSMKNFQYRLTMLDKLFTLGHIYCIDLQCLINFLLSAIFIVYNKLKMKDMGKRQYRELDDSVKQKISQSMRGRSKSESHKEHISNGLKLYWKQIPNKPFDEK